MRRHTWSDEKWGTADNFRTRLNSLPIARVQAIRSHWHRWSIILRRKPAKGCRQNCSWRQNSDCGGARWGLQAQSIRVPDRLNSNGWEGKEDVCCVLGVWPRGELHPSYQVQWQLTQGRQGCDRGRIRNVQACMPCLLSQTDWVKWARWYPKLSQSPKKYKWRNSGYVSTLQRVSRVGQEAISQTSQRDPQQLGDALKDATSDHGQRWSSGQGWYNWAATFWRQQ